MKLDIDMDLSKSSRNDKSAKTRKSNNSGRERRRQDRRNIEGETIDRRSSAGSRKKVSSSKHRNSDYDEEYQDRRRAERREHKRREVDRPRRKRRQKRYDSGDYGFGAGGESLDIRSLALLIAGIILLLAVIVFCCKLVTGLIKEKTASSEGEIQEVTTDNLFYEEAVSINISDNSVSEDESAAELTMPYAESDPAKYGFYEGYNVSFDNSTSYIADENVLSEYGVIISLEDGHVIAQKNGSSRINPASMTKIMTVLVAAEHVTDLDDKVVITQDDTNYAYSHDLSIVGFDIGEEVTVKDLFYGTILPSGGDAAHALAVYVAGSEEDFAVLMNDKLAELGLSNTAHFTNCSGIYNENHYCTLTDMAMILKAAESNEFLRDVLISRKYTTSSTSQHPTGIEISNWFLRRIEDKDTHGEVCGAKTGFVNESGCCAASYAVGNDGKQYICVTVNAWSAWRCIYDHVQIYQDYIKAAN